MSLTKDDILELMTTAKALGLTHIEVDGFKASIGSVQKHAVDVPDAKAEDLIKAMNPWDEITEEEILFYSTPYYDELQAKKKLQQEAAKQTEDLANG